MTTTAEALAQGWQLHQAGQWAAAEQIYRQVLQTNPADANAWCYLGIVCHDQDRLDEAVAAYRRAIQLQPNFPIAFNNLGNTLRLQRKLADAVACFDQALRLKPDYVNAHKNKGTALVWEGRLEEALACYGRALEFAPDDADTHKNRGVILLLLGRFDEGWPEYAWRWQTDEVSRPKYPQPLWDGSPLDGKTILLTAEQGLGDAVHFIRYAAVLKQKYDCRVLAACPKPLLRLLRTVRASTRSSPRTSLLRPLTCMPPCWTCLESSATIPRLFPARFRTCPPTRNWSASGTTTSRPTAATGSAWPGKAIPSIRRTACAACRWRSFARWEN